MTKSTPKNVLITGSSGYVGQHLIASLVLEGLIIKATGGGDDDDQQYELFCAYNSLPTFENDLNQLVKQNTLHPSIHKITLIPNIDFSNPNYIQIIQNASGENKKKIDAIIHLAALSSPGYCEQNSSIAWKVNCPTDLLTFHAPIIYMSTDQVYEGTKQFYQEDADETVPVNVYGRTKLAFERVLLRTDTTAEGIELPLLTEKELGGTTMPDTIQLDTSSSIAGTAVSNSIILRSSLILGPPTPFQNGCRKGAFPSFLQFIESRLLSSTPANYFINEFRSVVHVEDVIRSIRHFVCQALLDSGDDVDVDGDGDGDSAPVKKKTSVFNLGGSTRASRYDVALEVAHRLKCDASSANGVDRPPTVPGGVRSPPDISMNVDKLTEELGVVKMDGLKEIVLTTFK